MAKRFREPQLDLDTAPQGVSASIPKVIDSSSSGGGWRDSVDELGGLADTAKKSFITFNPLTLRRADMKAVIKKSDAQEPFSFAFVNDDGSTLLRSENYAVKNSAVKGIESVKKNCTEQSRYELKTAKNGKFFFNIKASNGQVVGTSVMFATEEARSAAITQMQNDAPNAAQEE